MRRTIRLIVLAGALLWAVAMPVSGALAAGSSSSSSSSSSSAAAAAAAANSSTGLGNPFSLGAGGGQVVTQPATTPASASSSSSSGGFSSADALIIAFVAVLLIVGVGLYVRYDARQHVPSGSSDRDYFENARKGSKAPSKSRKLSAAERKRRKRGRAR